MTAATASQHVVDLSAATHIVGDPDGAATLDVAAADKVLAGFGLPRGEAN